MIAIGDWTAINDASGGSTLYESVDIEKLRNCELVKLRRGLSDEHRWAKNDDNLRKISDDELRRLKAQSL